MKKVMFFAILAATINSGCKKQSVTTTLSLYLPWNLNCVLLPSSGGAIDGVRINDVSGVLTACKISGSFSDTAGTLTHFNKNWELTTLTDSVSSVKLNTVAIPHDTTIEYSIRASHTRYDDGLLWNESATNNWTVNFLSGSSFTMDIDGTMPTFTGSLPTTINSHSDFEFTFNPSIVQNADYAYVVIYEGDFYAQSAVVNAHVGVAKITAAQFATPMGIPASSADAITILGGNAYKGRFMFLVLFNRIDKTIGGKKYAFIKQRVIVSKVILS